MRRIWLPAGIVLTLLAGPGLAAEKEAKKADAASSKTTPTAAATSNAGPAPVTLVDMGVTPAAPAASGSSPSAASGTQQRPDQPASRRTPDCPIETCSTNCNGGCDLASTQNDDDTGLTECILASGVHLFCTGGKTVHEISRDCVNNCPPPLHFCVGRQTTSLVCE